MIGEMDNSCIYKSVWPVAWIPLKILYNLENVLWVLKRKQ